MKFSPILVFYVMLSCVSDFEANIPEPVVAEAFQSDDSASELAGSAQIYAKFQTIIGEHPNYAVDVSDLAAILKARDLEDKGENDKAFASWQQALASAESKFGEVAFEGWMRSYLRSFQDKLPLVQAAQVLKDEAKGVSDGPYLAKLAKDKQLDFEKLVHQYASDMVVFEQTLEEPIDASLKPDTDWKNTDFLLTKNAKNRCKSGKHALWVRFFEDLPTQLRNYWLANIAFCSGDYPTAYGYYKQSQVDFAKLDDFKGYNVEALAQQILIERRLGKRREAADNYLKLVESWKGVRARHFGTTNAKYLARRINDFLWAARYRALIGDHEKAKSLAQSGLEYAQKAQKHPMPKKDKEEITELHAEAFHILAYRVLVELRRYESAYALMEQALEIKGLPEEWRDRFMWHAALYQYLSGEFTGAIRGFERLLAVTRDEDLIAGSFYWLAETYRKLGNSSERQVQIEKLKQRFPLSYYAAISTYRLGSKKSFGDLNSFYKKLNKSVLDLGESRVSPEQRRSIIRAEVLTAAGSFDLAAIAAREVSSVFRHYKIEEHEKVFLYISRLYYRTRLYEKAIGLTHLMSRRLDDFWQRYPEQILIHYPSPFAKAYLNAATNENIDKAVLLGISRQESSFLESARSFAGAMGLMQIIKPTAAKYMSKDVEDKELENLLLTGEKNIAIGARYLKELELRYQGFGPAVYGGYNAGEYVMDLWVERRSHVNPHMFVELIPFGETKNYVKKVWRNRLIYEALGHSSKLSEPRQQPSQVININYLGGVPN